MKVKSLICVRLFTTPRTAAYQAPPPVGFSRQEYWSGLPLPSPIPALGGLKVKEKLFVDYMCFGYREDNGTPLQYSCLEKSHGWRSLVGCSPWGRKESNMTEGLHFHFSLTRIGEGNGNPLQCSCLENPRDGGAWLAAVYGVAQSRTRLK